MGVVLPQKLTLILLSSTTLLPLLLLPLPLSLAPGAEAMIGEGHPWRYIFPFFPKELDILLGHLETSVVRLKDVLEQCEDMLEGEWEGEHGPLGVMQLSATDDDDEDSDDSMEEKVDRILELREKISELEDKIEECRFHFWTGAEDD
ncbi:hypothetical protein ACOMHN_045752 [Nucella lapillus]